MLIDTNYYNTILENAIKKLLTNTNLTQLTPGGKARALLEIISSELDKAYRVFYDESLTSFVRYASGEKLDLIGELVGVYRRRETFEEAKAEHKIQKFYVKTGTFGDINPNGFSIPAGTIVKTSTLFEEQPVEYYVVEETFCEPSESEVWVTIRAKEPGSVGHVNANTLTVHNLVQYPGLYTTNVEPLIYARNEETDEEFRYRIVNQVISTSGANATAIRMAALSVPGIADVLFDEYAEGIGSAIVYVQTIVPQPNDYTLFLVQQRINEVKAMGTRIRVKAPDLVGVEMELMLTLKKPVSDNELEKIRAETAKLIMSHINKKNIGEGFYIEDLIREIYLSNDNIKKIGTARQSFNAIYIWKFSLTEDKRIRTLLLEEEQFIPRKYEKLIIENTIEDPIRISIKWS